uniref:Ribonuclease H-like domain-containing protein n=1 Tax=Tanacetum cinerariifolium TaxID=118510 RepID=A0A699IDW5_TANCI|nr:ribonuclease H-like domain-containing protein [Tanacetum cinerariifolium]
MKVIMRQFSVARTPQQNGVAERRNKTLFEAARTMLADSKLPTTFWAEAVNTACYVRNKVLVVKPHNKAPYELSHGSRPDWLFDIDALTRTMNREPIVAGTQSNFFADPKSSHDDGFKPSSGDGKKVDEDPSKECKCIDQEKEDNVYSTNNVNTVSSTVNAAGTNEDNELLFNPNMPDLKDVSIFNFSKDDEDDGTMADMNNLDTTIQALNEFSEKKDERGIMIRNKARLVAQRKIEEEVYVCQLLRFEDPDFPDTVYKVEKELYGLHQAPRAWFIEVKTASTPMETQKPLLKDEDGKEVDVHMYRYQVNPKVSHLHAVKKIFRASLDKKSTTEDC